MKRGPKGWGWGLGFMLVFLLAGCGGYNDSSSTLSESSGGGSSGGGTGITNTFSSPAEMSVGDIMPIEFGSSSVSVDFSSVASGAKFILTLGSSATAGSLSSIQLSTDLALPELDPLAKGMVAQVAPLGDESDGFGPQEMLSAWLRASETVLPSTEEPIQSVGDSSFSKAMSVKDVSVGNTDTFRVLGSLSSTSSYVDVVGEVRCVKSNVVFYVDTAVGNDIISDADVQTLCNDFDSVAGDEQKLLGEISDVDGDGKLHILMTKQINRLGALGGGIITGYFYAGDLYDRSSSNQASNNREVIYTMVPDPQGQYGTTISKNFAMSNLLPAVLPHELQHAISYNQHVFVNGGMPEDNWLNEGMSHLTEDVMGCGMENPSRYSLYLASPSTSAVVTQSSPNLVQRGASYLFLRYLYEQSSNGSAFLSALEKTSKHGVDNLESAFSGPSGMNQFSEFMARWSIALAMTDQGISQDGRYIYKARTKNSLTGKWDGVCLSCDADDGRGTVMNGVHMNTYYGTHTANVSPSALMFFNMTTLPKTMKLAGTQSSGNFGILIRYQ
ncbi:MAG: hypothetical protein V2A66_08085 [Pseudomonadota bacterium]